VPTPRWTHHAPSTQQLPGESHHAPPPAHPTRPLRRSLGALGGFAVACAYTSLSTGIFALFAFGLASDGAGVVWGMPLVVGGQVLVAAGFAELAAHYPQAGSLHAWTARLAAPTYAWLVGFVALVANLLTTSAVAYALASPLAGLGGGWAEAGHIRINLSRPGRDRGGVGRHWAWFCVG
jgi:amino acid transporter